MASPSAARRPQPEHRGDTVLFVLFVLAGLTLPFSLDAAQWAPQAFRLVGPAVLAAGVAFVLARSPLPSWLAGLLGTVISAEYSVQFVGEILPGAALVGRDLRALAGWIRELLTTRQLPEPIAPFESSLQHMTAQGAEMRANLARWAEAVQTGEVTRDTTFLRLALCFLIWIVLLYAGIALFRARRPLLALLPLGVAVVSNVAYTGLGIRYVYLYLATALLIMVWTTMSDLEAGWARRHIDFSSHLRSGAMTTGFFLSGAVILFAMLMPYVRYDRAVRYFWDTYGPRFEEAYDKLDRAFAGRNPVPTVVENPRVIGAHRVTGSPNLERRDIFTVRVSDPAPLPQEYYDELMGGGYLEYEAASREVPKRYWRERTYDAYTGRGWNNTSQEAADWAAGVSWLEELPEPAEVVTQTYQMLGEVPAFALAVNEPVRVTDHPYTVIRREPDDFVALSTAVASYTVVSLVPDATVQDLQEAEGEYPDWVAERYLSLDNVPERVQQTARDVVAEMDATTRYQKARVIEAYLRQFKYDLNVPALPSDQDLVEYLLFETGAGYCDHTASAMVVMLRSVGVAARYASGYNQGYYDEYRGAWVVQEANAHAWPEVYFPGYGWIEFEPTPSQSTFRLPSRPDGGEEIAMIAPPPIPEEVRQAPEEEIRLSPTWYVTAIVVLAGVFLILRPPRFLQSRRRRVPAQAITAAYRSLQQQASWLGLGPTGGQTIAEYVHYLKTELARGNHRTPGMDQDIDTIGAAYQRLRYSGHTISPEEGESAERAYRRLRGPLFRRILGRTFGLRSSE